MSAYVPLTSSELSSIESVKVSEEDETKDGVTRKWRYRLSDGKQYVLRLRFDEAEQMLYDAWIMGGDYQGHCTYASRWGWPFTKQMAISFLHRRSFKVPPQDGGQADVWAVYSPSILFSNVAASSSSSSSSSSSDSDCTLQWVRGSAQLYEDAAKRLFMPSMVANLIEAAKESDDKKYSQKAAVQAEQALSADVCTRWWISAGPHWVKNDLNSEVNGLWRITIKRRMVTGGNASVHFYVVGKPMASDRKHNMGVRYSVIDGKGAATLCSLWLSEVEE